MTTQPELFSLRAPHADPADVETLIGLLRDQDWMTAREILAQPIGTDNLWSDRYVRALANASGGRIIGWQKGYKLTRQASADEVGAAVNRTRNQIAAETIRMNQILNVYHAAIR